MQVKFILKLRYAMRNASICPVGTCEKFPVAENVFRMTDRTRLITELSEIRASVTALMERLSGESKKEERVPPPQIAERMAANLCIHLNCDPKTAELRGLCNAHYQAVRRMVKDGKLTDAEAVQRWLWLPEAPRGRKSKYSPDAVLEGAGLAANVENRQGMDLPNQKRRKRKGKK
jgi:hypothetical protein